LEGNEPDLDKALGSAVEAEDSWVDQWRQNDPIDVVLAGAHQLRADKPGALTQACQGQADGSVCRDKGTENGRQDQAASECSQCAANCQSLEVCLRVEAIGKQHADAAGQDL
jgi:hypothetical protein